MRSLRLPSRCRRNSCRCPGRGFRAPTLRLLCQPSITPRMSSASTIKCSSPSIFTSVPEYLDKTTTSPALTFTSSESPTVTTSAVCGFSLAVSGRTIPLAVCSSLSTILTSALAPSGFNLIYLHLLCGFDRSAQGNAWATIYQQDGKFAFSRDHDDTLEAHYSCLERPHACMGGWEFISYEDEYGEEREASAAHGLQFLEHDFGIRTGSCPLTCRTSYATIGARLSGGRRVPSAVYLPYLPPAFSPSVLLSLSPSWISLLPVLAVAFPFRVLSSPAVRL